MNKQFLTAGFRRVKENEMTKRVRMIFAGLAIVLLIAACQPAAAATPAANTGGNGAEFGGGGGGGGGFSGTPLSPEQRATRIAQRQTQGLTGGGFGGFGRSTPTPTPGPTDTPAPTPTVLTPADLAVQTVQTYFGDLQSGSFAAAAGLTSNLSRFAFKLTSADVVTALTQQQQQGAVWSNLQVQGTQVFNNSTILVHVTYQLAAKDSKTGKVMQTAKDELWPVSLENGQWLYNWNNIIDFNTLTTVPYQEVNGLTVTLLQVTRYSDHLTLTVMAQNNTNDPIVIGSANQILATFHFGGQAVDSANTQYVIDRLRGYSNIDITAKGLFTSYPTSVDLIKYKNFPTEKPWFTFNLGG
jgi:hypothetical protein